jgi:hypothetical protein
MKCRRRGHRKRYIRLVNTKRQYATREFPKRIMAAERFQPPRPENYFSLCIDIVPAEERAEAGLSPFTASLTLAGRNALL